MNRVGLLTVYLFQIHFKRSKFYVHTCYSPEPYLCSMKIAFDAKRAMQNFTGLGNYSRSLIENLATSYPQHQYQLFAPRDTHTPRLTELRTQPSVSIHTPTGIWQKLPALWRTVGTAAAAKAQGAHIFHGLSHELPFGLQKAKLRSIVTMHDLIHERTPEYYPFIDRRVYTLKFKHACRVADSIVAISEQTKRDLIQFYQVPEQKITVIYQACHPQFGIAVDEATKAGIKQKYQLPDEYLLYVGTVNERKNLLGLLHALELVADAHLVIAGNGTYYAQKVKNYLATHPHVAQRVRWLPQQEFADMPAIYQSAQALVLPSFFEGFGIPIIEALSSETPVITSINGCFAEAGGPDSLYTNPADPTDIAAAIRRVMTDVDMCNQMRKNGLQYVQNFAPKHLATQWINHYASIL